MTRKMAIRLHLWLGLVVGLLWSLQGLTGAALVFHREIDRWAHPAWQGGGGPMLPIGQLLGMAERQAGGPIKHIGVLDGRPDVVAATYADASGDQRTLILDASNGTLLGARMAEPHVPAPDSTSRYLYMLHEHLVSGETGEIIIGISGCLLLFSLLLGLWIAWPRRGHWRALFAVSRWRGWRQQLYGWHRLGGLIAAVLLVVIALSGSYMIFKKPVQSAMAQVVTLQKPYRPIPHPAPGARWIPAQTAIDRAMARLPDAQFVRLILPTTASPIYSVRLRQPGEVRAWAGASTVAVDALTGAVLDIYDAPMAPPANRLLDAQFSIHNGEILGLVGRMLVFLAGIALPAFYASGLWLWLRKGADRAQKLARPS